jgi:hypothetical protein
MFLATFVGDRKILTNSPSAVLDFDLFAELAGHDGFLAFQPDTELLLGNNDIQVFSPCALGNRYCDIEFAQLLRPCVRQG